MKKSKFISQIVLAVLVLFVGPLSAATIAHWTLDNTFNDSISTNHLTNNTGTLTFQTDTPSAGGSHSLNFTSSAHAGVALSSGDSGFTSPVNNFTFELFFKSTVTVGSPISTDIQMMASAFDHTTSDGDAANGGWHLSLGLDGTVIWANTGNGGSGSISLVSDNNGGSGYNDGEWHHAAGTLSSSNVLGLFVDGVSQGTVQGVASGSLRNGIRLGASHRAPSSTRFRFTGNLDEARLSDSVLSEGEFLNANVVPEPSTGILFIFGVACCFWRSSQAKEDIAK